MELFTFVLVTLSFGSINILLIQLVPFHALWSGHDKHFFPKKKYAKGQDMLVIVTFYLLIKFVFLNIGGGAEVNGWSDSFMFV